MSLAEINGDRIVIAARERLLELRERQVELSQVFLAKHPNMLQVMAQISQAERELQRAAEVAWEGIESAASSLAEQRDELQQRISDEEAKLATYRRNLSRLSALVQESGSRERLLEQLLTRLGEEEVASRLEGGQVRLIDPPRSASDAVNIRPALFVVGSLIVGMMLGIGAAMLMEVRDRRVRGMTGAMEAAIAGLARIPHAAGLQPLADGGDPRHPAPVVDGVRVLRSALGLTAGIAPRMVVLTSSTSGEGKSTIAARLAVSAAASGLNTLLIDADLRRPTQQHQFASEVANGLSEGIMDARIPIPRPTGHGPLSLIAAGEVEKINPEALSNPILREFISRSGRNPTI